MKTHGNNLKSLAYIFQAVVHFHPGHLHPKTVVNSYSAPIWQLLIKTGHYFQAARDRNIILVVQKDGENRDRAPLTTVLVCNWSSTKRGEKIIHDGNLEY